MSIGGFAPLQSPHYFSLTKQHLTYFPVVGILPLQHPFPSTTSFQFSLCFHDTQHWKYQVLKPCRPLQVLKDSHKSRREVDLHCRGSACPHVVGIIDVYENVYNNQKCLLVVMEW